MRILYLFPAAMSGELAQVEAGTAPSERLYGLVELRQAGHQVDLLDSRWHGTFGRLTTRLKYYDISLSDLTTLRALRRYDVVVVKDELSLLLTLAARWSGTRLVYLDSLFQLPRRWWRQLIYRWNFRLADRLVIYSTTQRDAWQEYFAMARHQPAAFPYTIDVPFYSPRPAPPPPSRGYLLSIGRDLGRDFPTLATAMRNVALDAKIVTLPYLLTGVDRTQANLHFLERLSYEALFDLYAGAQAVVIPLKRGITYPSGVRALLEAMALGKPVICSRTPVLEEYVAEGEGVRYVEPENPDALQAAITALADDASARTALGRRGREVVQERFGMSAFVNGFERFLQEVCTGTDRSSGDR